MTASLSACHADKLVKFLGMLGSDQPGERAAAALKADQLVRSHGLTWGDLLAPAPTASTDDPESMIAEVLAHRHRLTPWEVRFIDGVSSQFKPISAKQADILRGIVETLRRKAA